MAALTTSSSDEGAAAGAAAGDDSAAGGTGIGSSRGVEVVDAAGAGAGVTTGLAAGAGWIALTCAAGRMKNQTATPPAMAAANIRSGHGIDDVVRGSPSTSGADSSWISVDAGNV